jgi:uncharacterized coiled-coil protein SlyX
MAWLMEVVSEMIAELKRTKDESRHALQSVKADLTRENDHLSATVGTLRAELTALKTLVSEPSQVLTPTPPRDTPLRRGRPSSGASDCCDGKCTKAKEVAQLTAQLAEAETALKHASGEVVELDAQKITVVPSIEVDSKFFDDRIADMEQRHRYEHIKRDEQYAELEAKFALAQETIDELEQQLRWQATDVENQAKLVKKLQDEVDKKLDDKADPDSYEAVLASELVAMREGFELQTNELRERMEQERKRQNILLRQTKDRHEEERNKTKKLKDMADIRVRQLEDRLKAMVELQKSASSTPTLTP